MSLNKFKKKSNKVNALLNLKADDDELMQNLRKLIAERDKLADKIIENKNEADSLKEILVCSSREDIEHVYEEFFSHGSNASKVGMTAVEKKLLTRRFSLLHNYKFQQLSGVSVGTINEKFFLVTFLPFPNYTPPELCLLKLEKRKKSQVKLDHFSLPDTIPMDEFEKLYLNGKSQDVPAFIHAVQQCLWCYWTRDFQVLTIKNETYMKESLIYHNKNRTVISFTLHFLEKFNIEISLRYDKFSYLPHTVQFEDMEDQIYPNELKMALEELKNSLLQHAVSSVLKVNLLSESSREGSIISTSTASRDIELFE